MLSIYTDTNTIHFISPLLLDTSLNHMTKDIQHPMLTEICRADITIFILAAVRHLGFVMTSQQSTFMARTLS